MKKTILLLFPVILLFPFIINAAYAQTGSLQGKVTDAYSKDGIPFASIHLFSSGIETGATTTDLNGNYAIKPLSPGKYGLCITIPGYDTVKLIGIEIKADVLSFRDIKMNSSDPKKNATSDGNTEDAWSCPKDNSVIHSNEPVYYYLDGMLIHGIINIPNTDVLELRVTGSGLDARYENESNKGLNFTLEIPNLMYPGHMSWYCNY